MGNHLFDLIKARMPGPTAPFAFLDDGRTYTYADMVAVSARFANALVALGVERAIALPCRSRRAWRR